MATKRKIQCKENTFTKKHTLDSDEEDSDGYEKEELNNSDIEGEEDGEANTLDEVKITPFNMREELEEGHFDTDGLYHWNKNTEMKDNWLDEIDWLKIKKEKKIPEKIDEIIEIFNPEEAYLKMLNYMRDNETVQNTLQRLGKMRKKTSTAERIRLKKLGITDECSEQITNFTEIVNEILKNTGNMDIYEENYSQIKSKAGLKKLDTSSKCDMYSDDFDEHVKECIKQHDSHKVSTTLWEFKIGMSDTNINGPYTTEQIIEMKDKNTGFENFYIRKVGEATNFYSCSRIDFELYL